MIPISFLFLHSSSNSDDDLLIISLQPRWQRLSPRCARKSTTFVPMDTIGRFVLFSVIFRFCIFGQKKKNLLPQVDVSNRCGNGSFRLEGRALSGTPGRPPLIMDRSLFLLCQVLCGPDWSVFSQASWNWVMVVMGGGGPLPSIDLKMSKLKP